MAKIKTTETDSSLIDFINTVAEDTKRNISLSVDYLKKSYPSN